MNLFSRLREPIIMLTLLQRLVRCNRFSYLIFQCFRQTLFKTDHRLCLLEIASIFIHLTYLKTNFRNIQLEPLIKRIWALFQLDQTISVFHRARQVVPISLVKKAKNNFSLWKWTEVVIALASLMMRGISTRLETKQTSINGTLGRGSVLIRFQMREHSRPLE